MKCVQCGNKSLKKTTTIHELRIGDDVVRGTVPAEACPKCKEVYVSYEALKRLELHVAAIVARAGIVNGETFRFMRKALGLPAKDMIAVIGTPAETISRWEKGARDVDRFAWITLAMMVLDAAEKRTHGAREIVSATLAPPKKSLPKSVKVA